ncbi:MAG: DNA methyltransferase, partial [Candidatus Zixiibacteriota bacterium]
MEAIVRVEGNTAPHCCPSQQDLAVKRIAAALTEICATQGNTKRGRRPFPHPFPARMPLEVAVAAVQRLAPEGGIVLDPMSGSGVVPRAAQLAGRTAIGLDIDPLAVALGRAMTAQISSEEYSEAARR